MTQVLNGKRVEYEDQMNTSEFQVENASRFSELLKRTENTDDTNSNIRFSDLNSSVNKAR